MYGPDTETVPVSEEEPVPRLVSLALGSQAGTVLLHRTDPYLSDAVVETSKIGWYTANGAFDFFVLWRHDPKLLTPMLEAFAADRVRDVLVAERLIRISQGERKTRVGLATAVKERLGWTLNKGDVRTGFARLLNVPVSDWDEESRTYALEDAQAHYCLGLVQDQRFASVLDPLTDITRRALVLHNMSLTGMATDQSRVFELESRLQAEIDRYRRECLKTGLVVEEGGKFVRKKAPVQVMIGQLAEAGHRCMKTKSGQWSAGEEALIEMGIPEGHPLDMYRRLGSRQTQLTKVQYRKGRVFRTNYDEVKVTGRMGASGFDAKGMYGFWASTSDNGQNTPKEKGFRECQRARDGKLLVCVDWSAIELRTAAQIQMDWFGRSRLAEVFREGRDPHSELGANILGIPVSAFDRSIEEHDRTRQLSKAPNFGFLGLMGAERFIGYAAKEPYNLTLTLDEARGLKKNWEKTWPESKRYLDLITSGRAPGVTRQGPKKFQVKGPRTGLVRGQCGASDACNFPFQGLAATVCSTALWDVWMAALDPSSPLYRCALVLVVHDEIVIEAPEDRASEAQVELERLMNAAFERICPDVPSKVEGTIQRNYSK